MFLDMFTYALPAYTHTSGKQSKKAVKIFAPICVSKKKFILKIEFYFDVNIIHCFDLQTGI